MNFGSPATCEMLADECSVSLVEVAGFPHPNTAFLQNRPAQCLLSRAVDRSVGWEKWIAQWLINLKNMMTQVFKDAQSNN